MANENLKKLLEEIQIPPSAYEKAEKRYKDIGEWFSQPEAECSKFQPHIYPQGSFRLGTVNKPMTKTEEYDLDMGCRLTYGASKLTHTQKEIKEMVGRDLEKYRKARGIHEDLEEMRRCWRLHYADELSFHLDAVPSLPEDQATKLQLREAMSLRGLSDTLASAVSNLAGAVPDNRSNKYAAISDDWHVSNSEGFAQWFESRMKLAPTLLESRAKEFRVARIDELPARQWSSPLQQAIQLLKRHRDVMFEFNDDSKPISVIITTLAARAYNGEADVESALRTILANMDKYISAAAPRVANPVNPAEDFADKWSQPEYRKHNLEHNFNAWLASARADFASIIAVQDLNMLKEMSVRKFQVQMKSDSGAVFSAASLARAVATGSYAINDASKPWCDKK